MRYRSRLWPVLIVTILLLLSLPGVAKASIFGDIKHSLKKAVHDVGHGFRGAKNETVHTAKAIKRGAVKSFKGAKHETKHAAKTVKRGVVNGFKDVKTETKRAVKTVKRDLKKLKND